MESPFPQYQPSTSERIAIRIKGVYSLWTEWLYSFGALTLTVALAFIIHRAVLPIPVLILAWLLNAYVAPIRERRLLACVRVTSLTSAALVWIAVVMTVCEAVVYTPFMNDVFPPDTLNHDIPYITCLIVFPVTAIVMAAGLVNHGNSRHCRACKMRLGYSPEDSFAGNVFHREAIFQLKLLLWISVALSVICWTYYLVRYSNANMNDSDKYFFLILPVTVFFFSLIYTGARYHGVIEALKQTLHHGKEAVTTLRYLILHGDKVLLMTEEPDNADQYMQADTPAIFEMPYAGSVSNETARHHFAELSGLKELDFKLRPLYSNLTLDGQSSVFHYGVILDDKKPLPEDFRLHGEWVTLDQIGRLWKFNGITCDLAAELNRILTVTMAWKTYNERGFRRYPIKHYRPTFRLSDFPEWNVDYADPTWLMVASNNQDRPMFHVRRFLRKITGKQA